MQSKVFSYAICAALCATAHVASAQWAYKTIDPSALQSPPMAAPEAKIDAVDAKLHSQLRAAMDAKSRGVALSASSLPASLRRGDQVLVEVRFKTGETAADAIGVLEKHGATRRNSLGDSLHEAWMPIDRLRELADEPDVVSVAPARLVRPLVGNKTSEGVAASNANIWQAFNPAYNGTGITIALVDAFDNTKTASLQSSLDWPASSKISCFNLENTSSSPPYSPVSCTSGNFGSQKVSHGNATMEIAYDMAPGATYRAYDTITVGDWRNAILDAANVDSSGTSQGAVRANVISASLAAPLDGIGDGSSQPNSIAEAAGFAKNRGIFVVNAAGNEQENHWGGLFSLASNANGGGYHTWSGTTTIYNPFGDGISKIVCIPDGTTIFVDMYWNDWVSGPTHDYNLNLYQDTSTSNTPNWVLVAASNNLQNGGTGQTPTESITYVATGGSACTSLAHSAPYAISVTRAAGTTANDNLQVFATTTGDDPMFYRVAARSLVFPADSPNVISVAAIDVANTSTNPQEPFSSEGPVLAAGGALPSNPNPLTDSNLKPDVASFDNVSTVTFGKGGVDPSLSTAFLGTSAATPHVAGMAALFMQRFGVQSTSVNLVSKIITPLRAIASTGPNDLGTTGKDYLYGYGRLRFQQDSALVFTQEPTTTLINTAITPAVKVELLDSDGNIDLYSLYDGVTMAIGNNPGSGVLSGGGFVSFVQGVATFSALKINAGGNGYTLVASSSPTGLTSTSTPFNINTGAAAKLAFTVQPSTVVAGKSMTPAVQVSVEDSNGNIVTSGSQSITLQKSGCTTSTPSGGGPITVVNGVATFSLLKLYTVATGAKLTASATGLTSATSNAFNVTANTDIIFQNGFETCTP